MKKTLWLILSLLVGGIVASSMGCASEQRCPNAPKVVATFSVGQEVALTHYEDDLENCIDHLAVIEDITYVGHRVLYTVRRTGDPRYGPHVVYEDENLLKAVVYPDPALAPRGKQKE